MFRAGERVFLQVPGAGAARPLHRGCVLESQGHSCTARFAGTGASAPGSDVLLYHEPTEGFVQYEARVSAVLPADGGPVLCLEVVGGPVPAERRRQARVSYLSVYRDTVKSLVTPLPSRRG